MNQVLARAPGNWAAALPVSNSTSARRFFVLTTALTIAVMLLAAYLPRIAGLSRIFVDLFVHMDYWATVSLLLILIGALLIPNTFPHRTVLRWVADHPGLLAAAAAIELCAGSLLVYRNHPLAMDEYTQLLQSQVFAAGHLNGHFSPALLDWLIPKVFQGDFLVVSHQSGDIASVYWPSFALLLTPFTLLGIPWVCNPLVSAATVLAIHRLALRISADRQVAGLAVLLTLASPVFFGDGISYYSMSAHLLANCLYALLLTRPTPRRLLGAGVVGSVALTLHNPVPHILFALPWLVWLATRPQRLRLLACIAVGYAPLCVLLGLGWFWFIGELRPPDLQSVATTNLQFEHLARLKQVFGAPDEPVLWARLIGIAKIWAWAVPGLLLLAAQGAWSYRNNVFCSLLACSAVVTLMGYLFVVADQGHGWGFRYFHSAWLALPILGAIAVRDDHTRALVVSSALLTLVFGVGFRAWQVHDFIADDLAQLPAYSGTEPRVIMLDTTTAYYGADLVQNDPWLRGNVIRMLAHGKSADEAMMRTYFPQLHRVYADEHGSVWAAR